VYAALTFQMLFDKQSVGTEGFIISIALNGCRMTALTESVSDNL